MWNSYNAKVSNEEHFFPEENSVFNFSVSQEPLTENASDKEDCYSQEDYKKYTEKLLTLLHYLLSVLQNEVIVMNEESLWDEIVNNLSKTLQPCDIITLFRHVIETRNATRIKAFTSNGWNPFITIEGCKEAAIYGLITPCQDFNPETSNSVFTAIFEGMQEYYMRQVTTSRTANPLNMVMEFESKNKKYTAPSLLQKLIDNVNDSSDQFLNYLLQNGKDVHTISYKNWPLLHEMVLRGNLDAITILIEKGANPWFTATRERSSKEDTKFDANFLPGTIWWNRVSAIRLSSLKQDDDKVNYHINKALAKFCQKNHVSLESYFEKGNRELCSCKMCKFHPDFPKTNIYHVGGVRQHFKEDEQTKNKMSIEEQTLLNGMSLYGQHLNKSDYKTKVIKRSSESDSSEIPELLSHSSSETRISKDSECYENEDVLDANLPEHEETEEDSRQIKIKKEVQKAWEAYKRCAENKCNKICTCVKEFGSM